MRSPLFAARRRTLPGKCSTTVAFQRRPHRAETVQMGQPVSFGGEDPRQCR